MYRYEEAKNTRLGGPLFGVTALEFFLPRVKQFDDFFVPSRVFGEAGNV